MLIHPFAPTPRQGHMEMWNSLLSTIQIDGPIVYPPYADRELVRYEKEIGHMLPKSYCDFCRTFGPGKLAIPFNYNIAAPGPTTWQSFSDIRHLNKFAKDCEPEIDEFNQDDPDILLASRAIYFCSDIDIDLYFWDTGDVTLPHDGEFAVYVKRRLNKAERLADTFFDFIINTCFITGASGDDMSIERRRIFIPAVIPALSSEKE
jgi:hypothetical protein